MTSARKIAALTLIGAMAAAPFAASLPAFAATSNTAASTSAKTDKALIKTSDNAFRALREVRGARLAIFDGQPEKAKKMTNKAVADMTRVQTEDKGLALQIPKAKDGDAYIPVDTSISLADGFVATPEKAANIKKANEHIAKGESKEAAEVLKLANIDVVVSAAMLPTKASMTNLEHAKTLLDEGKFYQANLALKAVENGVVVDSYGLDSLPARTVND